MKTLDISRLDPTYDKREPTLIHGNKILGSKWLNFRDLCWSKMYESGTPGLVVAIAVNGKVKVVMCNP